MQYKGAKKDSNFLRVENGNNKKEEKDAAGHFALSAIAAKEVRYSIDEVSQRFFFLSKNSVRVIITN